MQSVTGSGRVVAGRYQLLDPVGHGAMGTVWRAVQLSTRRQVALKLLPPWALGSRRARRRFEREVELTARLEHPHIARVYDGGTEGDICSLTRRSCH